MTNTQQVFEPAAALQDAFSLRKMQMLILCPLFVCLALAPLLFSNSEYYDHLEGWFCLSAFVIAVLHIGASAIIRSIEISSNQMPEIINKIDNEVAKKYIKIQQVKQFPIKFWTFLFAYVLISNTSVFGQTATADINWEFLIIPDAKTVTADMQNYFVLTLFIGIMMYLFEMRPGPYCWWSKKKRINNIVTMALILLCVVAGSRLDLVIDGIVPTEQYFPKLEFAFLLAVLALVVISFLLKVLPKAQVLYYKKLSEAKGKSKNMISVFALLVSALPVFLVYLSSVYFDTWSLGLVFDLLLITLGVKWVFFVKNNAGLLLLENGQSDFQIKYEKSLKKNKLFQNRKLVLMYVSIARHVDNNFSLLLFSALLHGVMLSALIFL